MATAEYEWPIWLYLNGTLHAALGNVYNAHLSDFSPAALRYSVGAGLRSTGRPDARLTLLVALGSSPFNDGGRPDSFRFLVGTQHGL